MCLLVPSAFHSLVSQEASWYMSPERTAPSTVALIPQQPLKTPTGPLPALRDRLLLSFWVIQIHTMLPRPPNGSVDFSSRQSGREVSLSDKGRAQKDWSAWCMTWPCWALNEPFIQCDTVAMELSTQRSAYLFRVEASWDSFPPVSWKGRGKKLGLTSGFCKL